MSELVLYDAGGTPSPRRVKMCLLEKGLPFTIRWLNIALMDQKAPSYLKLNPTGLVPTLVHDGKTIFESNVINEYIEALYPNPPLVPKDAYGQAQMRMWFAFENDFGKPFRDAAYETFAKDRLKSIGITPDKLRDEIGKRTKNEAYLRFATKVLTTARDDELVADRQQILLEKMAQMEDRLADGRAWLCGDQFTLADIALAPRVDMFPVIGVTDLYSALPAHWKIHGAGQGAAELGGIGVRPEPGETERNIEVKAAA